MAGVSLSVTRYPAIRSPGEVPIYSSHSLCASIERSNTPIEGCFMGFAADTDDLSVVTCFVCSPATD